MINYIIDKLHLMCFIIIVLSGLTLWFVTLYAIWAGKPLEPWMLGWKIFATAAWSLLAGIIGLVITIGEST